MSQNNDIISAFESLFAQGINFGNYTAIPNTVYFTIQSQIKNQIQLKDETIKKLEEEINKSKTIPKPT